MLSEDEILKLYQPESRLYGMRWDEALAFARRVEAAVKEEMSAIWKERLEQTRRGDMHEVRREAIAGFIIDLAKVFASRADFEQYETLFCAMLLAALKPDGSATSEDAKNMLRMIAGFRQRKDDHAD